MSDRTMRLAALAVLFVLCAGCAGLHGDRTVTSDVTGVWVGEWVSRGGQVSPATLLLDRDGTHGAGGDVRGTVTRVDRRQSAPVSGRRRSMGRRVHRRRRRDER